MRNVITNHIFEHYRKKQRKIEKAKTLLRKNNHVVYEKKIDDSYIRWRAVERGRVGSKYV